MTELEYTVKQTQRSIEQEMGMIGEAVGELQTTLASGSLENLRVTDWTDGYVARNVAKVTALLARYAALTEALRMGHSQE